MLTKEGFDRWARDYDAEQEACRSKFRDIWDDDELYILVGRLAPQLEARGLSCRFDRKAFCSGILAIQKQ